MLLFRVWQSRVCLKTTPGDGNKSEKVRMNKQEGAEGAAPVPAVRLGASLRCQGIPGPCADVTRVYASCLAVRVFECAWLCPFKTELSAIRSLPGCLCECEAEEKRSSTRRNTDSDGRCTAAAATRRNNPHNIEKKGQSERLSDRQTAPVSRLFLEEAAETDRDYRATAPLSSAGWSGISLQARSTKLTDTDTIKHTVDLEEPDTHF